MLNEASLCASKRIRAAVDVIADRAGELFLISFKLEAARNYLAVNTELLSSRINDLDSEIRALKLFSALDREFFASKLEDNACSLMGELSERSDFLESEGSLGLGVSFSTSRTLNVVRGNEGELQEEFLTISFKRSIPPGIAVTPTADSWESAGFIVDDTSVGAIVDAELEIGQSMAAIKESLEDEQEDTRWAGRAQRHAGARRPRGRLPRTINLTIDTNTDMDKDKEITLQPQRFRSLSGRCTLRSLGLMCLHPA